MGAGERRLAKAFIAQRGPKHAAASDGWARCEKTRIAAHRREWKRGQRDQKPENEVAIRGLKHIF